MVPVGREGIFVREFLVHAEVVRTIVFGKTVAMVLRLQGRVGQDQAGQIVAGVVLRALGQVDVLVAPVNEQIRLKNPILPTANQRTLTSIFYQVSTKRWNWQKYKPLTKYIHYPVIHYH